MVSIKSFEKPSFFRCLAWCSVFAATLLAGCDRISGELAHRGLPNPPKTDWNEASYKAFRMCSKMTSIGLYADGEKRSCGALKGLRTKVASGSSDLKATVYGQCFIDKKPVMVTCGVARGHAVISSIKYGYYRSAYTLCREAFKSALRHEYKRPSKVVVLDYGVVKQDLDKKSPYKLEFAIRWKIYGSEDSPAPDKRLPLIEHTYEYDRVTCETDDNKVVKLTYRELGNLTWDEEGRLDYFKFFKRF
ncbi:MAG: hypothetical protein JKX94_03195 [Sneathiella sp.]|nr:hypothetical protein [Sneathiella sp.]